MARPERSPSAVGRPRPHTPTIHRKGFTTMGLDNPIHLAFLLVILLLVFGAKRLPEMGRSLGSGLRGFKESINGHETTELTGATPGATATPAVADEPTDHVPTPVA